MKIDKAIEILQRKVKQNVFQVDPDALDALELGIEALKAIRADRGGDASLLNRDLPGETL